MVFSGVLLANYVLSLLSIVSAEVIQVFQLLLVLFRVMLLVLLQVQVKLFIQKLLMVLMLVLFLLRLKHCVLQKKHVHSAIGLGNHLALLN